MPTDLSLKQKKRKERKRSMSSGFLIAELVKGAIYLLYGLGVLVYEGGKWVYRKAAVSKFPKEIPSAVMKRFGTESQEEAIKIAQVIFFLSELRSISIWNPKDAQNFKKYIDRLIILVSTREGRNHPRVQDFMNEIVKEDSDKAKPVTFVIPTGPQWQESPSREILQYIVPDSLDFMVSKERVVQHPNVLGQDVCAYPKNFQRSKARKIGNCKKFSDASSVKAATQFKYTPKSLPAVINPVLFTDFPFGSL
jgi:hypothetical protein